MNKLLRFVTPLDSCPYPKKINLIIQTFLELLQFHEFHEFHEIHEQVGMSNKNQAEKLNQLVSSKSGYSQGKK